jgi:hypothetical protein
VLLRHATPIRNLRSIERAGLLCSKSQGRRPVVWLHSPSKSSWAVLHVVKRHDGRVQDVVIIEADVPRRWLRRNRRRLWFCPRDVPPSRFRRVIGFAEIAGPSADERRLVAR